MRTGLGVKDHLVTGWSLSADEADPWSCLTSRPSPWLGLEEPRPSTLALRAAAGVPHYALCVKQAHQTIQAIIVFIGVSHLFNLYYLFTHDMYM